MTGGNGEKGGKSAPKNYNVGNLKPFDERTESERQEIARKGGVASGEARRRKKEMRNLANILLDAPANPNNKRLKKAFDDLGVSEEDRTKAMELLMAQLRKGVNGDTKAAEFVRDTAGQKPVEKVETAQSIVLNGEVKEWAE